MKRSSQEYELKRSSKFKKQSVKSPPRRSGGSRHSNRGDKTRKARPYAFAQRGNSRPFRSDVPHSARASARSASARQIYYSQTEGNWRGYSKRKSSLNHSNGPRMYQILYFVSTSMILMMLGRGGKNRGSVKLISDMLVCGTLA